MLLDTRTQEQLAQPSNRQLQLRSGRGGLASLTPLQAYVYERLDAADVVAKQLADCLLGFEGGDQCLRVREEVSVHRAGGSTRR